MKYPLAAVSKLLEVFGEDLGGGYDIGCKFKTTLAGSSIGPCTKLMHHTCLVGAFHGHAHSRICQLSHLTTYVEGLGIEDLETCEHIFSKSNALASATHYVSVFHRQQAITTYFQHNDDFETYANLSKYYLMSCFSGTNSRAGEFLYNNYKQALDILSDGEHVLPGLMQDLGVTDVVTFEMWLKEEKSYLEGLQCKPEEETVTMEYWQRLVKLNTSK